jgi:hypothetical protein
MALEKYLLDYAKDAPPKNLESWCKYLIKNSKSASITAIVTSLILAHPEKLLNIAKILFRTKEFFFYETARVINDQSAKSLYSIGSGLNYKQEIYETERIKTCDDAHRKFSLEDIARNYQFFSYENEEDFTSQQNTIWEILDKYYADLPPESQQTEDDKTWRIYLARMDRRKMSPTVEKEEDGNRNIVYFNPELAPDLKEISDQSSQTYSEKIKYVPLQLWANSRFKREKETYEKYQQYEENSQLALIETKEIIDNLSKGNEDFSLFNRPTPSYVCAVLLRDFFDTLNQEEKEFCSQIIIEFAMIPILNANYYHQVFDGTQPAIISLTLIITQFPEQKADIKSIMLLLLLCSSKEINTFVVNSFHNGFWDTNFDDAQSIFFGYVKLKPEFKKLTKEIMKKNYDGGIIPFSGISTEGLIPLFIEKYESDLDKICSNQISSESLDNLEELNLSYLTTAFYLLPLKTQDNMHHNFVTRLSKVFADNNRVSEEDKKSGFELKYRVYKKLAYFVLSSTEDKAKTYVQPFIDSFESKKNTSEFFSAFVSAEDELNQYDNFWIIWNLFYDKIVEICRESSGHHYTKEILHKYLLGLRWKEDAKHWRSLKEREKLFFQKIARDIGQYPPILFSLSKFLNEIGNVFLDDGIIWISDILQNNKNLVLEELENGTIYYLENLARKYILTNRSKIKTTVQIKKRAITILDFLVEKGSVTGYLLRENTL